MAMAAEPKFGDCRDGPVLAGIHIIGHRGAGFWFDNERPAHQVLLQPVRVARALVTNGDWLEFIADGGYTHAVAVVVERLGRVAVARLIALPVTGSTSTAPGLR